MISDSFSVASALRYDGCITQHICKVRGGEMSAFGFGYAKKNDLFRFERSLGTFLRDPAASRLVMLATRSGIAPIKVILEELQEAPAALKFQQINLHWGFAFTKIPLTFTPVLSRDPS